jgi:hypothetical protein
MKIDGLTTWVGRLYVAMLQTHTNCGNVLRNPFGDGVYFVNARTSLGQCACDLINEYSTGKTPTQVNKSCQNCDEK